MANLAAGQLPDAKRISIDAPAKVNLFLHVCGLRHNGYHSLESLVAFTELSDRISIRSADDLSLSISGPFAGALPEDRDTNLAFRAAEVLIKQKDLRNCAQLTLEKNLPVSSGVGGGSADAAAVLRALAVLWRLDVTDATLAKIGMTIGADVPACIHSAPAIVSGTGETVLPQHPIPPCGVVLVNAGEPVATSTVFMLREGTFTDRASWPTVTSFDGLIAELSARKNDLFASASQISPIIKDVLAAISETANCALARMSGSGGTCFGLYKHESQAAQAAAEMSMQNPGWWCAATKFRAEQPRIQKE
ncbi:MAG: 4-(cytidine 5'-diphospho)-2-C-methyl-D-erythritol kinase [Pseudomonadota bacterium]|nr:4-(cytidine 5'-diphospho)-2-C-methyl-D-erythritol kinase [Pseudomonadota bacterium]